MAPFLNFLALLINPHEMLVKLEGERTLWDPCLKANNLAKADLRDVTRGLALCANLDSAYMQTGSKNRLHFPNSHVMHVPYFCAVLSKNSIPTPLVVLNLWVFSCTLFQHRHQSTSPHNLFTEGFFLWAPPSLLTTINIVPHHLFNC